MPYLIYGILGTVTGVLTFFLPETLGEKLPQTVEDVITLGKYVHKTNYLTLIAELERMRTRVNFQGASQLRQPPSYFPDVIY